MSRLVMLLAALIYAVLVLVCWQGVQTLDDTTFARLSGLAVTAGLLALGAGIAALMEREQI